MIWMAYFRMRMARFPIEYNQDGRPKMRLALRNLGGWHKPNMDGSRKIWMALLNLSGWHKLYMDGSRKMWMALRIRSGFQMLNMDEKRTNIADFAKGAAKNLFQRHCKKSTNNGNSGIF